VVKIAVAERMRMRRSAVSVASCVRGREGCAERSWVVELIFVSMLGLCGVMAGMATDGCFVCRRRMARSMRRFFVCLGTDG